MVEGFFSPFQQYTIWDYSISTPVLMSNMKMVEGFLFFSSNYSSTFLPLGNIQVGMALPARIPPVKTQGGDDDSASARQVARRRAGEWARRQQGGGQGRGRAQGRGRPTVSWVRGEVCVVR